MADKSVGELIAATSVTPTDLFVLEQNGTAKKLTGQILENWLVSFADGHGGIQSIVKIETNVLADTYRITLADTTTFDFVVTNGRGVNSITKKSTSGLVDTYTITYNDGTTGTFTVTNGAKGDQGDNAYIWVKYASQEPTTSSNSFGDLPDDWMGVYFGTSSTAPTNWQSYKWYRIKGEKGDTGEPATIVSAEITYQTADSGTIIPSGSWSASVPPVTPGRYLWTRQVLQFNTGAPITSYSVSRFGIDGTGAVSSVAGVAPDADGNVPLDAASLRALSLSGGIMEGAINMNGQKLNGLNAPTADDEAATKGFVSSEIKKIDVSSQISGKVDKTSIVNNFTTTEEGFVADARALKVLNESKLSMELLWENASPTSEFAAQSVPIENDGYRFLMIKYKNYYTDNSSMSNIFAVGTSTFIAGFFYGDSDNRLLRFVMRNVSNGTDTNTVTFGNSTFKDMDDKSPTVNNQNVIPTAIYGIK